MKKPLPTSFLAPIWQFDWADALWGVEHAWAEPALLVELAMKQLLSGEPEDRETALLAGLSPSDGRDAVELASQLVRQQPPSKRKSAAIWLYLSLRWVFENRASRRDPLGDVEEIYCEFNHPPEIEQLVRYMPAEGYNPLEFSRAENETRLFNRWARFLQEEGLRLRH